MASAFLLALQVAAGAASPAPIPADFDLAKLKPPQSEFAIGGDCRGEEADEIVVCGRRRGASKYPLEEMERRYKEKPIRAEMGIGGGATARAYVEQVEMPQGQVSKRVMFGIKTKF